VLYYQTIDAPVLELLKKLQQIRAFSSLRLAGGTSLALQIGHRKSIDLDLFGILDIDELALSKSLAEFGQFSLLNKTDNIHIYLINGIKVDIVNYHYPWLDGALLTDNLVLAGKKDIAAMKLAAITGRGTKKDFIDVYFLLKYFSLTEMLGFYSQKYPDGSAFLVLKSLSFFEDADDESSPVMIEYITWEDVKTFILETLSKYLQNS
jgi:Nucleotidyl transferase AbiEii toxin, Type IV TA system